MEGAAQTLARTPRRVEKRASPRRAPRSGRDARAGLHDCFAKPLQRACFPCANGVRSCVLLFGCSCRPAPLARVALRPARRQRLVLVCDSKAKFFVGGNWLVVATGRSIS